MEISAGFIAIFTLMWIAGPLTQVLFLAAPKLHHKLGLMEADAYKPEYRWYLLEERAIAYADMTKVISGIVFVWLALLGIPAASIFGLYVCACYVYIASISIPRWLLLSRDSLSPLPRKQLAIYISYMVLFLLFGLYGLSYLWDSAQP